MKYKVNDWSGLAFAIPIGISCGLTPVIITQGALDANTMALLGAIASIIVYYFCERVPVTNSNSSNAPSQQTSNAAVRSNWEIEIATWVKREYPNFHIRENDRNVIATTDGRPYELDLYIPELHLAFELNGEHWHDHTGYNNDRKYGTHATEEMQKQEACTRKGITLIHIWDSESMEQIHGVIRQAIKDASH